MIIENETKEENRNNFLLKTIMAAEAKEYKQPYIENIDVAGIVQGRENPTISEQFCLQESTTEEGRGAFGEFTINS